MWPMPLLSFEGRSPQVDPTAFVAPTEALVGDVTVEAGATVAHLRCVHGAHVGAEALIANHATVLDGTVAWRAA